MFLRVSAHLIYPPVAELKGEKCSVSRTVAAGISDPLGDVMWVTVCVFSSLLLLEGGRRPHCVSADRSIVLMACLGETEAIENIQ